MAIPTDKHSNSWILTRKKDGSVIGEFYEKKNVEKFDPKKVRIETAYQYLTRINREIKTRRNPNTWKKAKKDWYAKQRQEASDNRSYAEARADFGRFCTDERNCELLGPWFDKLIAKQKKTGSNPSRKTRRNPTLIHGGYSIKDDNWKEHGFDYDLEKAKRIARRLSESLGKTLWVTYPTSKPFPNHEKNLAKFINGREESINPRRKTRHRKTRRNEGDSTPAKTKISTKTILGVGVAALALYYVLRKRASAAAATPTFQTPPASPINSSVAVRVGQRYADAAKMLTDYRIPFRLVRQDGRAFAITKDRNPYRWNLSVNRGIVVGAYKG